MGRRILRMSRGRCERRPCGVGLEQRIAAARPNSGDRPPEAEGVLGVPTADAGVREAGPERREEACGFGGVQRPLCCQLPKGPRVLLAGMLGPKEAGLGLLGRADGAVCCAEGLRLIVIVDPLPAVEWRGTFVG